MKRPTSGWGDGLLYIRVPIGRVYRERRGLTQTLEGSASYVGGAFSVLGLCLPLCQHFCSMDET